MFKKKRLMSQYFGLNHIIKKTIHFYRSFVLKRFIFLICCLIFPLFEAHGATVGKVAAVVNGEMISSYDVQQTAIPEIKKRNLDPKKKADQGKIQEIYDDVLNNMILEILIINEARRQQIVATEAEVDAELTRAMQKSRMSKEAFEKQIKKDGFTVEGLRTRIHNTILRQKLMGMMVGRKVVLRPEEVEDYYNTHRHEMKNDKQTVFALLIYPDSSDAPKYASQIKKDGKKFEQIVRELSIGPNKENGGLIGDIPMDKMDPRLAKILKGLQEGEATPIIVLNGKRAQFKLVQKAAAGGPMTFEQAKPIIENILREPMLKERFEEYVAQLRKKAMIDIRQ